MNPIPLVDLAAQRDEIAEEVAAGWATVLERTAFVGGPQVAAFEAEYAEFVGVAHYAPTRPNNLAEQLSEIEDVTVKKPDAILFMAVDPRGVVPAIEKVNAAGIPLVNYNDRVRGGKFVSYVAADDFNAIARGTGGRR